MVTYADESKVMAELNIDPLTETDRATKISDLNKLLSRGFDEQCQRTFGGGVVTPETRETSAYGTEILTLSWAAITITSVAIGGEWDGSGWTGETVLAAYDWRPWHVDRDHRIWGLRRMGGTWNSEVRITGVWADNPGGVVPDDVVALLTNLVVNHDLLFRTSAAGMEGPDENGIRPMNPWSLQISKLVIAKYRLPRMVV